MVSPDFHDKPGAVPASDRVTEPLPPPPPPPTGHPPGRRLTRSRDDRYLGGVSSGLGRYFAIDPVMFRIGFIAAAFAGGAGVLAYVAAWLLVPAEGAPQTPMARRPLAVVGAVVLGIVALAIIAPILPVLLPAAVLFGILAAIVLLVSRGGGEHPGIGLILRRSAILGGILLLASAGALAVAVGAAVGGGPVLAGLVVALGLALIGAGLAGRGRWLVLPALVVAIPLALVAAADVEVDASAGERAYRPAAVTDIENRYELGMGELVIDLRDVTFPPGTTTVALELGVGAATVLVTDDVCVDTVAEVGLGEARVLGRESSGSSVDVRWRQRDRTGGTPRVAIDAEVGVGELRVARQAEDEMPLRFDTGLLPETCGRTA